MLRTKDVRPRHSKRLSEYTTYRDGDMDQSQVCNIVRPARRTDTIKPAAAEDTEAERECGGICRGMALDNYVGDAPVRHYI